MKFSLIMCIAMVVMFGVFGRADIITDPNYTIFLAHYDGTTAHEGKDADFAVGDTVVYSNGGIISTASAKFGAGSVDVSGCTVGNLLNYSVAGNYEPDAGTIEMWIKPNEWITYTQSGYIGMFSMWLGYDTCDIRLIRYRNNLRFYAWQDGLPIYDPWSINTYEMTGLGDGQWHHLAWTWDTADNTTCLYVDGILEGGPYSAYDVLWDGTLPSTFDVGTHQNGWDAFPGLIDEFRISSIDRYKAYQGTGFTPQTEPWPGGVAPDPICGDSLHPIPDSDLTGDCVVNFEDFAIMADNWLVDNRP